MNWQQLSIPLVAGIFALIGAFVGAFLTRKTEYQKWVRQSRAQAFEKFLRTLTECEDQYYASAGKLDTPAADKRWLAVERLFQPTYNEALVTRLYLDEPHRVPFWRLVCKTCDGYAFHNLSDGKIAKEEIQKMFEAHLWAL